MAMGAEDPVKRHEDQIMKEQVDKADLIVTGTVTTVRLPDEQAPGNMLAPAGAGGGEAAEPAAAPSLPRSEHDPMWREAVINIASKEKGDHAQNEVVVRFPGSRDIAWYQAPKFIPGQQGVFFLHKQQLGGGAEGIAAMGAGGEEGVYAVLQSADFQPIDKLADIQAMAAQPPGPDNG
jgi:hypothetical protein